MYNIHVRYFDGFEKDYQNISKICSTVFGEFDDENISSFLINFKGNLHLTSEKTTYIISCENLQSIKITKN